MGDGGGRCRSATRRGCGASLARGARHAPAQAAPTSHPHFSTLLGGPAPPHLFGARGVREVDDQAAREACAHGGIGHHRRLVGVGWVDLCVEGGVEQIGRQTGREGACPGHRCNNMHMIPPSRRRRAAGAPAAPRARPWPDTRTASRRSGAAAAWARCGSCPAALKRAAGGRGGLAPPCGAPSAAPCLLGPGLCVPQPSAPRLAPPLPPPPAHRIAQPLHG